MVGFSVELAIVDFLVPIIFSCSFMILKNNLKSKMEKKFYSFFVIGMSMSLVMGFIIPTYKLIVGLGFLNFTPPGYLVVITGIGLLIAGISLFINVFKEEDLSKWCGAGLILPIAYLNMIWIILGVVGEALIYISLIKISKENNLKKPIIFLIISFCFIILMGMCGSLQNINSALTHWILEIENVCTQIFLLLAIRNIFPKKRSL
ncbi:hypothetical protein [Methanobrevibacter sp.]|uniref:hypothetical protein n=1 Tax=Methanobrevibacter sp. TaxID=66852 RepID=UPI00389006A6